MVYCNCEMIYFDITTNLCGGDKQQKLVTKKENLWTIYKIVQKQIIYQGIMLVSQTYSWKEINKNIDVGPYGTTIVGNSNNGVNSFLGIRY